MKEVKGYKTKTDDTKTAQMSSDERERRKTLWEIINKPGYDPATKREAQRLWIEMQKGNNGQVRGA